MTGNSNRDAFATRVIHAGQQPDPLTGAVMVPIYTASTFVQDGIGKNKGYNYTRSGNPTREALHACVADLENAEAAFAFPSGLSAAATILELLDHGSHILASDDLYGGVYRLLADLRPKTAGHEIEFVDFADLDKVKAAIRPDTAMMWFETPSNPLMKVIDLASIGKIGRANEILTVCDNTFCSPYIQQPINFGIDVVMHSATKYMNGHSDLLAGLVATSASSHRADLSERMKYLQNAVGAVLSPVDSFTLLRSLKTLHLRMERHCSNAMVIAEMLEKEKDTFGLSDVIYPGLESHPGHEIAKQQMNGFGGIISMRFTAGMDRAEKFMQNLRIFQFAVSLGGVESLVQHPSSLTHATLPVEFRDKIGVTEELLRLSVGVEDATDLMSDLRQAFVTC